MIKAFIGVGSNIDPQINIEKALGLIMEYVDVTGISLFYKTKPLFDRKINDFLNGVWQIKTNLTPEELKFNILKKIEKKLHRKKSKDKYCSRVIDLDLLLFGNEVIKNEKIIIPDPDVYTRPFIYVPLYELAPDLIFPDTGKPIKELVKNFDRDQLILMKEFSENLKGKILG